MAYSLEQTQFSSSVRSKNFHSFTTNIIKISKFLYTNEICNYQNTDTQKLITLNLTKEEFRIDAEEQKSTKNCLCYLNSFLYKKHLFDSNINSMINVFSTVFDLYLENHFSSESISMQETLNDCEIKAIWKFFNVNTNLEAPDYNCFWPEFTSICITSRRFYCLVTLLAVLAKKESSTSKLNVYILSFISEFTKKEPFDLFFLSLADNINFNCFKDVIIQCNISNFQNLCTLMSFPIKILEIKNTSDAYLKILSSALCNILSDDIKNLQCEIRKNMKNKKDFEKLLNTPCKLQPFYKTPLMDSLQTIIINLIDPGLNLFEMLFFTWIVKSKINNLKIYFKKNTCLN